MKLKKFFDGIKTDLNQIQYLIEKIIYLEPTFRKIEDSKDDR